MTDVLHVYILRLRQYLFTSDIDKYSILLHCDCLQDERSHSWKFVFVYTGPECGGQEGRDGAGTGL